MPIRFTEWLATSPESCIFNTLKFKKVGFKAFYDDTTPITVLDETQKKTLGYYVSVNKTELYTGIDSRMITKLANASHSKPYYCERLKQNVFIRKTELLK